jgi:hypothetical protein
MRTDLQEKILTVLNNVFPCRIRFVKLLEISGYTTSVVLQD